MQTDALPLIQPQNNAMTPPEPQEDTRPLPLVVRAALAAVLVVAAFILALGVAPQASQVESHQQEIQTLDEKKNNVLALVGTSTVASVGLSALPGDLASPIAEKLAELSTNLLVVLAVIYLEKFLLTTLSFVALGILLPAGLVICAACTLGWSAPIPVWLKSALAKCAQVCIVLGLMLQFIIPASIWVTNRIDETHAEAMALQIDASSLTEEAPQEEQSQTSDNPLDAIVGFFQNTADTIVNGAQQLSDTAVQQISNLIDSVAVMIVTSCVIPLLVLALFLWLTKTLVGIDLGTTSSLLNKANQARRSYLKPRKSTR